MNPLQHYHLVLERLLGPDGSVPAAVAAFVAPIEAADDPEPLLEVAWDLLVPAAAGSPDALQHRLVALVTGVQAVTLPGVRVWEQRVFADLPMFGERMRQAWDEPHDPVAWVRLNAFAARLTSGAAADFLPLGLRTVAAALESAAPPPGAVPAAVEWFRHAADPIFRAARHGRTFAGRLGDVTPRAEGGFSLHRWTAWRARFDTLPDSSAREGFRLMCRFDREVAALYQRP